MKAVKTLQKYKCDFCRKRSVKSAMERHEKICWRNPDRFCELCQNKGEYVECYGDLIEEGDCGLSETMPCHYCSQRDLEKEKAINEYEAKNKTPLPLKEEPMDLPF